MIPNMNSIFGLFVLMSLPLVVVFITWLYETWDDRQR